MKHILLVLLISTSVSLLFSQSPCNSVPLSTQNFADAFRNLFPKVETFEAALLDKVSLCATVKNGGGNQQQLTLDDFRGDGGLLTLIIYSNKNSSSQVERVNRTFTAGDAFPAFNFEPNVTYGISLEYLATGSFRLGYKKASSPFEYTQFTISAAAPVTWTRDLTYHSAGEQIELNWSVAEQVDVAGYELEKMIPGGSFEKLSEIAYRENGAMEVDYSVRTARPSVASYYRIKQLDYAGTFDYSNVLFVPGHDGAVEEFDVYPNPVADYARMSVPAAVTSVELISLAGRIVRSVPAAEVRREGMDVRDLAPGVYLVRPVSGSERSVTRRIVVNH